MGQPVNLMKTRGRLLTILIGIAVAAGGIVLANQFLLQMPMNQVIASDSRNAGIVVSTRYANYVNPKVLVFDVRNVSANNSEADVFRVLLQYAEKMQSTTFDEVELVCQGQPKFTIRGDYFQKLGKEYSWQNPVFTARTFPENVLTADGQPAYGNWQGGFIGVTLKQLDDFTDFHKKWWKSQLFPN